MMGNASCELADTHLSELPGVDSGSFLQHAIGFRENGLIKPKSSVRQKTS
jgi:hypothetical protein